MDESREYHNSNAPNNFMQDTPPRADVDEILRRKRKAREYKVRERDLPEEEEAASEKRGS
jgi:hypothetical protein